MALFFGSYRKNPLGRRVLAFLNATLTDMGHTPHCIDAAHLGVPFLEDTLSALTKKGTAPTCLVQIQKTVRKSDACLLISGEYNHLPHPGLLNLMNFFYEEYQGKPAALATYSVGLFGGVRTEYALRAFTGALGMPALSSMLTIAQAQNKIDEHGMCQDSALQEKTKKFLTGLVQATLKR